MTNFYSPFYTTCSCVAPMEDPCQSNPCMNHGHCEFSDITCGGVARWQCTCPYGYHGDMCQYRGRLKQFLFLIVHHHMRFNPLSAKKQTTELGLQKFTPENFSSYCIMLRIQRLEDTLYIQTRPVIISFLIWIYSVNKLCLFL